MISGISNRALSLLNLTGSGLVRRMNNTYSINSDVYPTVRVSVSQVQNVGAIAATAIASFTISAPGAQLGDVVIVSSSPSLDNNILLLGKVSATNTITIQLHNTNVVSPIDPPSATYRAIALIP